MNIEKYPNVDIPYMTVVIVYPGSSPEQAMKDIGEPIEREFLNIEGVKNVYTDGVGKCCLLPRWSLICLSAWMMLSKL